MSWAHIPKALVLRPKSGLHLRPFIPLIYRPQSLHLHLRCFDSVDIFMPLLFITLEKCFNQGFLWIWSCNWCCWWCCWCSWWCILLECTPPKNLTMFQSSKPAKS